VSHFLFCGPTETAKAVQVCRSWKVLAKNHASLLWKSFVQQHFRISPILPSREPARTDWYLIYRYLQRHYQRYKRLSPNGFPRCLDAQVVFADYGGSFPGYPAENALSMTTSMPWCTATGVYQNTDLVVKLSNLSLVDGFT